MATVVVFAVTAVTSVLGLAVPGVLAALERTPQGLHGDWWRSFTALFVQDGGILGTVSNLAFLALLGVLAERLVGPRWWLAAYFGAGLAGELAGYAWQPTGAGNSVAVCGLAGLLVVALAAGTRLPRLAPWPSCGGAGPCWRAAGAPARCWPASPAPWPSRRPPGRGR